MSDKIMYAAADTPSHQIRPDLLGTVIPAEHGTLVRWAVRADQPETPLHSHIEFEQITLLLEGRIRTRVGDEVLQRLRLDHVADRNPYTLSGGEKRRLSVATALVTAPAVVILDEPTFGQDRRTWEELIRLLADLADAGTAVVAVTHDAEFVEVLADERVALNPVGATQ